MMAHQPPHLDVQYDVNVDRIRSEWFWVRALCVDSSVNGVVGFLSSCCVFDGARSQIESKCLIFYCSRNSIPTKGSQLALGKTHLVICVPQTTAVPSNPCIHVLARRPSSVRLKKARKKPFKSNCLWEMIVVNGILMNRNQKLIKLWKWSRRHSKWSSNRGNGRTSTKLCTHAQTVESPFMWDFKACYCIFNNTLGELTIHDRDIALTMRPTQT